MNASVEKFKARRNFLRGLICAGIALCVVLGVSAKNDPGLMSGVFYQAGIFLAVVSLLAVFPLAGWIMKCPACGASFRVYDEDRGVAVFNRLEKCPHCGVKID